ncbi:MAG: hypothetical protein ACI8QC_001690 [Planctomycetota bacterium]|jgi:hypothetical protein
MQSTLLPAALIGLVSGGVAAAAVVLTLSPEPAPANQAQAANQVDVLARIDSIAGHNNDLQERLLRLENEAKMVAPTAKRELADAPASASFKDQLADLQAKLDALSSPTASMPANNFEDAVAAANKNIDARKRVERDEERQVREEQAMEDKLAKLTSTLGLDGGQVGRMRETLATQTAARRDLFTEMREGGWAGGRTEMRESMQAITDAANTSLQGFLTPSQFEDYGKQDTGGGFGRRGGGDNGGGGGRGGGF